MAYNDELGGVAAVDGDALLQDLPQELGQVVGRGRDVILGAGKVALNNCHSVDRHTQRRDVIRWGTELV